MQPYPHLYRAMATGHPGGPVLATATRLPDIETAPPAEFDGPGDKWSPETLLCAAVADCYILTFRAVARTAKFDWLQLRCSVEGTLERVDGQSRFTRFVNHVVLSIRPGSDAARARALLERAENGCLVANSLSAPRALTSEVVEVADG